MNPRLTLYFTWLFALALAQVPLKNGKCPYLLSCRDPNINMEPASVTGIWYLHANVPFLFQEAMKCTYFNYTSNPNVSKFLHLDIVEYKTT